MKSKQSVAQNAYTSCECDYRVKIQFFSRPKSTEQKASVLLRLIFVRVALSLAFVSFDISTVYVYLQRSLTFLAAVGHTSAMPVFAERRGERPAPTVNERSNELVNEYIRANEMRQRSGDFSAAQSATRKTVE